MMAAKDEHPGHRAETMLGRSQAADFLAMMISHHGNGLHGLAGVDSRSRPDGPADRRRHHRQLNGGDCRDARANGSAAGAGPNLEPGGYPALGTVAEPQNAMK